MEKEKEKEKEDGITRNRTATQGEGVISGDRIGGGRWVWVAVVWKEQIVSISNTRLHISHA